MHCSADLATERAAADANGAGAWEGPDEASTTRGRTSSEDHRAGTERAPLLDPDGLVDNSLTLVVGVVGGLVVGLLGTTLLAILTGSGWALLVGVVGWIGATSHLVRQRTLQAAVARSCYAIALVLLSIPAIALSPAVQVDGGLEGRGGLFVVLLGFAAVPAGGAALLGWGASRFVPADDGRADEEGTA